MCGGPAWKREVVADHKFDFIDTREFTNNDFSTRLKYVVYPTFSRFGCGQCPGNVLRALATQRPALSPTLSPSRDLKDRHGHLRSLIPLCRYLWLYILVLKSFLVYVLDIFTAVTMLTTKSWSNQIFNNCKQVQGCVPIPFNVGKWLFVGCIIFSFLLLAYEGRKAKKIIASRDISYAFTNVMANNYYSLRSYDHFCFFDHISQSTKKSDDFAFFIFFTFKSWKRLFFADGPRQVINALTLYAIYLSKKGKSPWYDFGKYFAGNNLITTALTISTLFTVVIFAGSLLLLIAAGICYIPLLCYIKGNLKEYCCHKVDKRISEIIKRRNKQRMVKAAALARKEAAGDFSHLKNKKGELVHQPLPQPTLPNISLDDDFDDGASGPTRGPSPNHTAAVQGDYYGSDTKSTHDYPAMPAYNPYSHQQDPNATYAHYNPSAATLHDEPPYDDDYGSTAHLALGAEPYAHNEPPYPAPLANGYVADPYDVYSGHGGQHQYDFKQSRRQSADVGLAYDEPPQDYPSPVSAGPPPRSLTSTLQSHHPAPAYGHRSPSPSNGVGYETSHQGRGGGGQYHAM
ncbi:hypothetical protein FA95DRAFT_1556738 [Auriscalpium vulgare]|uniref:Uncharacterized protein n=1 Tax=Auriscalpium vulgare TaxID=40419 RepID=A0ACB8S1F2_9AGAM|nr:hypothetical protein FA95DRAFT_1556738 [Auriscalpium vulgare]